MDDNEKKQKLREYKRQEYLKRCEEIKARQKAYYYRKKREQGIPTKRDKFKFEILHLKDHIGTDTHKRFIFSFD